MRTLELTIVETVRPQESGARQDLRFVQKLLKSDATPDDIDHTSLRNPRRQRASAARVDGLHRTFLTLL
jgi:hypothetical protein